MNASRDTRALHLLPLAARDDRVALHARCMQLEALLRAQGAAIAPPDSQGPGAGPAALPDLAVLQGRLGQLHALAIAHLSRVDAVQDAFTRHLRLFESVEVSVASYATRADAMHALQACRDHGHARADDTPPEPVPIAALPARGYAGVAMRADPPITLAEAAFSTSEARIVGPVPHARRNWLVERLMPPTSVMNDGTYEWCEDLLVAEALARNASTQRCA